MLPTIDTCTFNQDVLQSATPVLVSFWAPWCSVCRWVEPLLTQMQADYGSAVKIVSINADANLQVASQYQLTNIPSLLLFDRGHLVHRIDHFRDRSEALHRVEEAMRQIVPSLMSSG